jgi:hypothetical protein
MLVVAVAHQGIVVNPYVRPEQGLERVELQHPPNHDHAIEGRERRPVLLRFGGGMEDRHRLVRPRVRLRAALEQRRLCFSLRPFDLVHRHCACSDTSAH